MVNIQPIKSMRQHMRESQSKADTGQRHLELGNTCMKKAIERNMDPVLVQRAMDFYSLAMDENPEKPQAYLAMAYLSWKLNESEVAQRFLNHILAIHPHQVQANALREKIALHPFGE